MRFLLFVFVLVFTLNAAAQSSKVTQLFADGTAKANQEHFADALQSYEAALKLAENEYLDAGYRARLRFNMGVCYYHLDKLDRAIDQFKSALLLKNDFANAHDALALAESNRRYSKRAIASMRVASR